MRTAQMLLAAVVIAGCAGPAPEDPAQPHQETSPTTGADPTGTQISLVLDSQEAAPGDIVSGTVEVLVPAGLHAYSQPPTHDDFIPLSVRPSEGAEFQLVSVTYPQGEIKRFPLLSDQPIGVYEGVVRIPVIVRIPAATEEPQVAVSFDVETQLCDDAVCFPPETLTVHQTVTILR